MSHPIIDEVRRLPPAPTRTYSNGIVVTAADEDLHTRFARTLATVAHRRGRVAFPPCTYCQDPGRGDKFSDCVVLDGYMDGRCTNCHWQEAPSRRPCIWNGGDHEAKSEPPRANREQMSRETKEHLVKAIERAVGRTIDTSGGQFDIRKSELDGPYSYEWIFSREYPNFPDARFSKWNKAQLEACDEALERGYLTVIAVDSRRSESGKKERPQPRQDGSVATYDVLVDDILVLHRKALQLSRAHKTADSAVKIELDRLRAQLQVEKEMREKQSNKILALEKQVEQLRSSTLIDEKTLADKIAQAKEEAWGKAFSEMDENIQEELRESRRRHWKQLERAKKEAFEQGVEAGKQQTELSFLPDTRFDGGTRRDREPPSKNNARAPEQSLYGGQKDSRDSDSEDDSMDERNVAQRKQKSNIDHRNHYLQRIHENWHAPPQKVLSEFMPEWHIPSGTTLSFLATLSDRVDWLEANELLRGEIELRNKGLPKGLMILTTSDVRNAIGKASSGPSNATDEPGTATGVQTFIGARPRRSNVPEQSVELPVPRLGHVRGNIQKASAHPGMEDESRPRANAGVSILPAHANPGIASSSVAVAQNIGRLAVAQFSEYQSWRKRAVPDGDRMETQSKKPKTIPQRPRSGTVSDTESDTFDAGSNHRAPVSGVVMYQSMDKTPTDTIRVEPRPSSSSRTTAEQTSSDDLYGATPPVARQRNSSFSHDAHREYTNREHTTSNRVSGEKLPSSSANGPRATELLEKADRAENLRQQDLAKRKAAAMKASNQEADAVLNRGK